MENKLCASRNHLPDEDNGTSNARFGTGTNLREVLSYATCDGTMGKTVSFAPGLQGIIALNSLLFLRHSLTISGLTSD